VRKTENECVNCALPCIGSSCKYANVTRYYCDYCGDEATLYHYEGDEICVDCLLQNLEIVEGSDVF
jgi:hypothetical protein